MSCIRMTKQGTIGDTTLEVLLGTMESWVRVRRFCYFIFLHFTSGTDLWLWLSFFRTGRADVFRIAYALTRHLSETDTHHTGPFAGLGSRHNVSHWGDGAKEARVACAWLRRPFYYLTSECQLLFYIEQRCLILF